MGKGDIKSKKGKRKAGSFGVSRPKKKASEPIVVEKKKPAKPKKAAAKKPAAKKAAPKKAAAKKTTTKKAEK